MLPRYIVMQNRYSAANPARGLRHTHYIPFCFHLLGDYGEVEGIINHRGTLYFVPGYSWEKEQEEAVAAAEEIVEGGSAAAATAHSMKRKSESLDGVSYVDDVVDAVRASVVVVEVTTVVEVISGLLQHSI